MAKPKQAKDDPIQGKRPERGPQAPEYVKIDTSMQSFGAKPVTPPALDTLPESLRSLAGDAPPPKPARDPDLRIGTVTSLDDLGRFQKRLTPAEVDAIAPRFKLIGKDVPFPRERIVGITRYASGYEFNTDTRPYYVKDA